MGENTVTVTFDRDYIDNYLKQHLKPLIGQEGTTGEIIDRSMQVIYDAYRSAMESGHSDLKIKHKTIMANDEPTN